MKGKPSNKKNLSTSPRATTSVGVLRASLFGMATATASAVILLLTYCFDDLKKQSYSSYKNNKPQSILSEMEIME